MNVFLIGYRGCGKTEVGRALGALLQREWVDMDAELARRFGATIAEHVERCGWLSFRRAEHALLQELCSRGDVIVSTGGGVGADTGNVAVMRRRGAVVWLCAEPETIARRIAADPCTASQRPALRPHADTLAEIRMVLAERSPGYARAADVRIDTDELSVQAVCGRIAAWLENKTETDRLASS